MSPYNTMVLLYSHSSNGLKLYRVVRNTQYFCTTLIVPPLSFLFTFTPYYVSDLISTCSIAPIDNTSRSHLILFTVYIIMYTHSVNSKKKSVFFSIYVSICTFAYICISLI